MSHIFLELRNLTMLSVALRLLLAMLCGGAIGLERERKHRPAGFRTYMLVCLGAALTVLLSQYEYTMLSTTWKETAELVGTKTDVSRFGAQVINGIGFLGAGTILVTGRQEVKGLTTAAGLWASACMGIAIGAGFYECVIVAIPLIFLCMYWLPSLETAFQERSRQMNLYVEFDSMDAVKIILHKLKQQNAQLLNVDIGREAESSDLNHNAVFSILLKSKQTHPEMIAAIGGLPHVTVVDEI